MFIWNETETHFQILIKWKFEHCCPTSKQRSLTRTKSNANGIDKNKALQRPILPTFKYTLTDVIAVLRRRDEIRRWNLCNLVDSREYVFPTRVQQLRSPLIIGRVPCTVPPAKKKPPRSNLLQCAIHCVCDKAFLTSGSEQIKTCRLFAQEEQVPVRLGGAELRRFAYIDSDFYRSD